MYKLLVVLMTLTLFSHAREYTPELTLEEKVGQLLIVQFHGDIANEEAENLIQRAHVGGFIYYTWTNGLEQPEQVKALSASLQRLSPIPLWICIDQEGGPVARLGKGFTQYPGNRELGQTGDPALAYKTAKKLSKELLRVGVNMNLAPVVDISLHPDKSFMTKRTYGDDPITVAKFARNALKGYREGGVMAVLKHFPGCGDVQVDPHYNLPVLSKTKAEMEKAELYPFYTLRHRTDGIMTTHLMVPKLDPIHCATLSFPITTSLLRKDWGYKGLIISDSLVMQGLLEQCPSLEEAAIRTLEAGCDLLIFGGRQLALQQKGQELESDVILRIHQAIVDAVKTGRLPLERIQESVNRSLKYKKKYIKHIKVKS